MGQGHFADLSFPTLIETDEPISFVSVGVSAVALVTQSKKLNFSGYIGQCKKSQLKENALSLDKNLSLFKHTLIDAHVSAVGLGRTHCVLFIDKIMNSSHNSSFEVLETNYAHVFYSNSPCAEVFHELDPIIPYFSPVKVEETKNYWKNEEEVIENSKLPQISFREQSGEVKKKRNTSENPFKALLAFQKAKEEARDLVKNFKLYENQPLTSKPHSEDKLLTVDPKKKLFKMKSLERQTDNNFFPNVPQPFPDVPQSCVQQQRIKDLESLISRYDNKISKYKDVEPPRLYNYKALKRTGGGFLA